MRGLRKTNSPIRPPTGRGLEIVVWTWSECGKPQPLAHCFVNGKQVPLNTFLEERERIDPAFSLAEYSHLPGIRDLPEFSRA